MCSSVPATFTGNRVVLPPVRWRTKEIKVIAVASIKIQKGMNSSAGSQAAKSRVGKQQHQNQKPTDTRTDTGIDLH